MATTAHILRQQVLDQLYQILKDPLLYGNSVLLNIVNAPKDGLVSLKLVYSLTSQLKPYPLEYVAYCVPRDLDQRFRWSSDFARVGLKDNARFYETNAFGFIEEEEEDLDDHHLNTSKPHHPVQPVIYDNGKFYIDDEHHRSQGPSRVRFYEYDRLDIQPLASDTPLNDYGFVCFNCDKRGHHFRDCPRPKDYTKINRHADRLFTHVERDAMKPGVLSQRLREALGMTLEHDEPPYYSRMRYYGYPPGYMAYTSSHSPSAETPMLKVYDGDYVIHTKDRGAQDTLQPAPTYTVDYPGLYTCYQNQPTEAVDSSTSYTLDQTQTLQQQWEEYYYYYNQQQYYQHTYYTPHTDNVSTNTMDHGNQATHDDNQQGDDMDISSGDEG